MTGLLESRANAHRMKLAETRIAKALELHRPTEDGRFCLECSDSSDLSFGAWMTRYPCETARALGAK